MQQPLRAVIFDFDGVILDSNALKTDAFHAVFSRFPEHAEAMRRYHDAYVSQSRYEKFTYLVERLLGRPGDTALVHALADDFATLLRDRMDVCGFVPGARDMLEDLSPRGPLYLASMTPEAELVRLLDIHAIHHHFRRVYGCPPWTKPQAVGAIVEELGGADGVALVGDSAGDQRAAAVHGVEFIPRDSGLAFDTPVTGTPDVSAIASRLSTRLAS
ncbi:MAG TPA: HAD family hydrolase [Vicinamibacterales bacterium]|nr:HAD family hydrolase [Vicinamibacterales bacterium]